MPKISFKLFLFWGAALVIAIGLFVFVRALTVCWRLTALPGIPPASCAGEVVNPLEAPAVDNDQNTPEPTATPEFLASEDLGYNI